MAAALAVPEPHRPQRGRHVSQPPDQLMVELGKRLHGKMGNRVRDLFRGYYQATPAEVSTIWSDGLIALDANVLLSLYKVLPTTSDLYLGALEHRSRQMWLPYQAGVEFHRNVHSERAKQTNAHQARIKSIDTFLEELRTTAKKSRLQSSKLQKEVEGKLRALKTELEGESKMIADQTHHHTPDHLLQRVAALFDGRVGAPPTEEELTQMHEDARKRFEAQVPPGYEDAKTKEGVRKYGDYILWRQILNNASELHRDFILVTDDDKSDWWLKDEKKKSLAPRPELIQEFRAVTGQEILILNSAQFYHHLVPDDVADKAQEKVVLAARQDMREAVTEAQAESIFHRRERGWISATEADESHLIDLWSRPDAELDAARRGRRLDDDEGTLGPSSVHSEMALRRSLQRWSENSLNHRASQSVRTEHLGQLRDRHGELKVLERRMTVELLGENGLGSDLDHRQAGELRIRLAEIRSEINDIENAIARAIAES